MHDFVETSAAHSNQSSAREKLLEHLFVGELLRCLWRQGAHDVEVLRAEVDSGGYDVVVECNGILRHIQLKSSFRTATTREVGVNIGLAGKPGGCVIWIQFDPESLELGPFLWFGGTPRMPLPALGDRIGKHSKGDRSGRKAERPNIRLLRRSQFKLLAMIDDVARALFGSSTAPDFPDAHAREG
jgi:hypothetical protein